MQGSCTNKDHVPVLKVVFKPRITIKDDFRISIFFTNDSLYQLYVYSKQYKMKKSWNPKLQFYINIFGYFLPFCNEKQACWRSRLNCITNVYILSSKECEKSRISKWKKELPNIIFGACKCGINGFILPYRAKYSKGDRIFEKFKFYIFSFINFKMRHFWSFGYIKLKRFWSDASNSEGFT